MYIEPMSLVLQMSTITNLYLTLAVFILVDAQSYGPSQYQVLTPNFPLQRPKAPHHNPNPPFPTPNLPLPRPKVPIPTPKVHGPRLPYPKPWPVVPKPNIPYPPYPIPRPRTKVPGPRPCINIGFNQNGCHGPYGNGRRIFDRENWNYMTYWQDGLGPGVYRQRSYPLPYNPYPQGVWARNYQRNYIPQTYFRPWDFHRYSQGQYMTGRYGSARRYLAGRRWFSGRRRYGGAGHENGNSELNGGSGYGNMRYGGEFGSYGRNFYPIFRGRGGGGRGRGYYDFDNDDDYD